ncbi:DMT family transporter [Streptomyces sp. CBMA123]|uniref:DMT family transporter n=1 Tax=Streptomyces sp. CBMA123 TaxID=1896313 RepID=UPI001661BB82|nr:DMT family transporter [Streptomyces sp. CBMA123]MBD0694693.1 multidrug DMT transporter permease [Streptomyces sp. CBMA123]
MSKAALIRLSVLSLVWGSVFLWIKLAGDGFSPVEMVFARLVLGAVVVLGIGFAKRQSLPKGRSTWGHIVVAALLGNVLPWLLFAYGEQTGSSSIAGILSGTAPVWTMTAAVALGSEKRLGLGRIGGIALGVLGVVLVSAPWSHDTHVTTESLVCCVVGAISFGSSFAYVGRFLAPRKMPVFMLAGSQLSTAAVLSAIAAPFLGLPAIHATAKATIALIVLGIVCTGFAVLLNTMIITKDGAAASATVVYLMTVVSVILGGVVLGEPLGWTVIAGTAAVLGATVLLRRKPQPAATPAAPAATATPVPAAVPAE